MKYVRTSLTANGYMPIDSSRYQVPNSTDVVVLPEEMTLEELRNYDLYLLEEIKPEKTIFQELVSDRVEINEETRVLSHHFRAQDLDRAVVAQSIETEIETLQAKAMHEGINFEGIFCDVFGNVIKTSLPLGIDAGRVFDEIFVSEDSGIFHVYKNVFVKASPKNIETIDKKYKSRLAEWRKNIASILFTAAEVHRLDKRGLEELMELVNITHLEFLGD